MQATMECVVDCACYYCRSIETIEEECLFGVGNILLLGLVNLFNIILIIGQLGVLIFAEELIFLRLAHNSFVR